MRKSLLLLGLLALILPLMFLGCGDDGSDGSNGLTSLTSTSTEPAGDNCTNGGQKIETGLDKNGNGELDSDEVTSTSYVCNGESAASLASTESCAVCHNGDFARDGDAHQEAYDKLYQVGVVTVTDLAYSNDNTNDIVTFHMSQNGADYDCTKAESLSIYFVAYDGTNFDPPSPLTEALRLGSHPTSSSTPSTLTYNGAGNCTSTKAQSAAGNLSGVDGLIEVDGYEGTVFRYPSPSRFRQVSYPFAAKLETGAGVGYVSLANVSGCENCHTVPFLKHGYHPGQINGTDDFYICKGCHMDNGEGGHFIWQALVTDKQLIVDLEAQYGADWEESGDPRLDPFAYRTRLMNDVHMSHAMEFLYPQSMSTCNTCHAGKLNQILTAANFTGETCKSCHAVNGTGSTKQAPALQTLWVKAGVDSFHDNTAVFLGSSCSDASACHSDATASGRRFQDFHPGYDDIIYASNGTKFANAITVSIDNATLVGTDLTIEISAKGTAGDLDSADITPAVLVGLYGYDTKDFIVNGHDRWDSNCNGVISRTDDPPKHDQPIGEYVVGNEEAFCKNPYWTLVSGGPGAGPWVVTAHLATWADKINAGTVKRVEVAVLPELENAEGELVGLNAVSRTFVLATNKFDDNFFGHNIANVGKCNNCHDQLATTFHDGDRGGSITVCRMCHVTLAGGSHLELQSRSIDSYVHAIHSFQAFDLRNYDLTKPIDELDYLHHVESNFPTFGTENCLACHNAGMFNVPDQAKSLPGILSGNQDLKGGTRNIGEYPIQITGPATRACGACHRAHEITADEGLGDAGELKTLFSHWSQNGYVIATTPEKQNSDLESVIDQIFSAL